jgi:hypothetical protein
MRATRAPRAAVARCVLALLLAGAAGAAARGAAAAQRGAVPACIEAVPGPVSARRAPPHARAAAAGCGGPATRQACGSAAAPSTLPRSSPLSPASPPAQVLKLKARADGETAVSYEWQPPRGDRRRGECVAPPRRRAPPIAPRPVGCLPQSQLSRLRPRPSSPASTHTHPSPSPTNDTTIPAHASTRTSGQWSRPARRPPPATRRRRRSTPPGARAASR